MFSDDFEVIRKGNGNVVVPVRSTRRNYALGAIATLGLGIFLYSTDKYYEGPLWLKPWCVLALILLAIWSAWQALMSAPVEFDVGRGYVRHGNNTPLPFAKIECIEISERLEDGDTREYSYPVALRVVGGGLIRLGKSGEQMESSAIAADIASLTGKPVRRV